MPFIPNETDASLQHLDQARLTATDLDVFLWAFRGNGVVNGAAVSQQASPGMGVSIAAGIVTGHDAGVNGSGRRHFTVAAGDVAIGANSSGLPRTDIVYVDAVSGTKSVVAGTPSSDPMPPTITSSHIVLAFVYVPNGVSAITTNYIRDKRVIMPDFTPVGSILPFGGAAAPTGWVLCQGGLLDRATYPALFGVLGTAFNVGGESGTQFRLPNLQQRFPLGKASSGTGATLGGSGGSIDHFHSGPSHTHITDIHVHDTITGTIAVASGAGLLAQEGSAQFPTEPGGGGVTSASGTGNTGSANPPYQVVNYIVKT